MWRVVFSVRVEEDVGEAAAWYESKRSGLGRDFVEAVIRVWRDLAENPWLAGRKHPTKNLRWRYPERFPYRIIYEIDEQAREVLILAVVHAARDDSAWRS